MMNVRSDRRTYKCEFVEVYLDEGEALLLLKNHHLPNGEVEPERKIWPRDATIWRDVDLPVITNMRDTPPDWMS